MDSKINKLHMHTCSLHQCTKLKIVILVVKRMYAKPITCHINVRFTHPFTTSFPLTFICYLFIFVSTPFIVARSSGVMYSFLVRGKNMY